jgi:hypothetical protein
MSWKLTDSEFPSRAQFEATAAVHLLSLDASGHDYQPVLSTTNTITKVVLL